VLLRYQHKNATCEFARRFDEFGLPRDLLSRYELLVNLDWLRPAFHVPIEPEWCLNWRNYPQHPVELADDSPHWAWAYDDQLLIDEQDTGCGEWFIHPYFRSSGDGNDFAKHSQRFPTSLNTSEIVHGRGIKLVPAYDYFFEWQLFRLAEIVAHMRGTRNHFWMPGSYDIMVRHSQELKEEDFNRHADFPTWEKRAEAFTWLAHYIAFDSAFEQYELKLGHAYKSMSAAQRRHLSEKLHEQRKEGTIALTRWLGVNASDLENSLKSNLLTLAQNWRWRKWDKTEIYLPLWRALQAQIESAVDWLCTITGKQRIDYLDTYRYNHKGQDTWAQLEDVLPYPIWKAGCAASQYIAEISRQYPSNKYGSLGGFSPEPSALLSIGSSIESFDDYIATIGRLIEESTWFGKKDDPYRARNRRASYRLIAVQSEIVLEEFFDGWPNFSAIQSQTVQSRKLPLQGVLAECLCGRGKDFDSQKLSHFDEADLVALAKQFTNAQSKEELVLCFCLAAHAVRNGLAHGRLRELAWLEADWAALLFNSLVYFIPWAMIELRPSIAANTATVP
jgi:hypothetical protein